MSGCSGCGGSKSSSKKSSSATSGKKGYSKARGYSTNGESTGGNKPKIRFSGRNR